jgi:Fic family protein
MLREPLLYLSLYLKQHRQQYYDLLTEVRLTGDWEGWLAFFAEAVRETAGGAVATARAIVELFDNDRAGIGGLGRIAGSALRVQQQLQRRPLATVSGLVRETGLSTPTVGKALDALVAAGIAREVTGRRRWRVFAYDRYLALLNEGTEQP